MLLQWLESGQGEHKNDKKKGEEGLWGKITDIPSWTEETKLTKHAIFFKYVRDFNKMLTNCSNNQKRESHLPRGNMDFQSHCSRVPNTHLTSDNICALNGALRAIWKIMKGKRTLPDVWGPGPALQVQGYGHRFQAPPIWWWAVVLVYKVPRAQGVLCVIEKCSKLVKGLMDF